MSSLLRKLVLNKLLIFVDRNEDVLRIISTACCDIIDYKFIGQHDLNDNPLPFKPGQIPKTAKLSFENSIRPIKLEGTSGTAEDEWMFRQILHRVFLLAKGCQSTAVLARQPMNIQKNCFELSKHLYLAWQAFVEMEFFKQENFHDDVTVNLVSAPALFHLSHEPLLHDKIINDSKTVEGIDHKELFEKISNGPGMDQTADLMTRLRHETQKCLQNFPECDEKSKLENILSDFQ